MYTVHVLKPHEAQRDLFSLCNLRLGQLYDLRCVWLLCILYIFKPKRRTVDEELDLAWLLTRLPLALDDERLNAYTSYELDTVCGSGMSVRSRKGGKGEKHLLGC